MGQAWQEHRTGGRMRALRCGLRALRLEPWNPAYWKSCLALAIKPRES